MAEALTATETMVRREGTRIALYRGPDRFDLQFATKKVTQDMQTSSMLSTVRLGRSAWYLVGAADLSPFFAYSDEPSTILVWADVDWSGDALTCKSTSAGAVQLESHQIAAWSVVQQVVSFSSAESETFAIEGSKVDRWETVDHRRKQSRRIGAYPETRAEDAAERTIQAVDKVPNTIDSINKEAKCTRKTKEKLLGARRALESSTQKAAVAHESRKLAEGDAEGVIAVAEFAFASPREPLDKISPGLDTLENAKESAGDLDTRVLEREAMPSRVSKKRVVVAVTSRFATPWSTRAQWSCFGFICGLSRAANASDKVIVSGYWSKRGNGTTTGVMEATDSISTFAVNAGAGGAVAERCLFGVWP